MAWMQFITVIASVCSLALSAFVAALSLRTHLQNGRHREMEMLIQLQTQYQNCMDALAAEPGNRLLLWNAINFVDHMCRMHNHRLAPRHVHEAIEGILTDFMTGIAYGNLESTIDGIALGANSYSELRAFSQRHASVIRDKLSLLSDKPHILDAA